MDHQTLRILRISDELLNRHHEDIVDPLADCLLEDPNLEILKRRLDLLDPGHIPNVPLEPKDKAAISAVDKFATVVSQLLKIVMALYLGNGQSPSLSIPRTKSRKVLIERWHGVVRWLSYLIQNAHVSPRFSKVVQTCSFFLLTVTVDVAEDPLTEELVCQSYFADLAFLVLYLEEPTTESYYKVPNNPGPDGDDSILRFVLRCFDAPASRDFLTLHFRGIGKEVQDEVARALVFRSQEIIADVKTPYLAKAVRDLQAIIVIFRWLVEDGGLRLNSRRHEGYIRRLAAAICVWSEKAETARTTEIGLWITASEYLALLIRTVAVPACSGNQGLPELLEGGLLPCTARCVLWGRSPGVETYLRTAPPYLYQQKTFLATKKSGDKRWWDWVCSPSALNMSPQSSHLAWHNVMRYAIRGFHGKENDPIDMCNNLQHSSTEKKVKFPSGAKVCGRCHSVAYCSAECQQSDWTHLHAKECVILSRRYQEQKLTQAWPSLRRKWDILRFITAYANEKFERPRDILKVSQLCSLAHRGMDPSGPSEPLLRFDPLKSSLEFVDVYCSKADQLGYYTRMSLQSLFNPQAWRVESTFPWLPRFQQFIDAVEKKPTTMILVEGRFRLNHYHAIAMFATMRYNPKAPSLGKYVVVDSAFRSIPR